MKEDKIKPKFKFLFYLLVIIYLMLYFSGVSGYYENKISNKTRLTKESILKFEQDIKLGKEVDIKDYIDVNNKDYQNKYSNLGYLISNTIDITFNDGLRYLVNILKTLFS